MLMLINTIKQKVRLSRALMLLLTLMCLTVSRAQDTYTRVDDPSTLQDGDLVTIGCAEYGTAMGAVNGTTVRPTAVTVSNGMLTATSETLILRVSKVDGNLKLQNNATGQWMNLSSSNDINWEKNETNASSLSITVSDGAALIQDPKNSSYQIQLQLNSGTPNQFKNYSSSNVGNPAYSTVELYGKLADPNFVAAPVINGGDSFTDTTEISMTCATSGASIYYTVDENEPSAASTLYENPFTISDTTVIKAIAIKGENQSQVTTFTATKVEGSYYTLVTDASQLTTDDASYIIATYSGNNDGAISNTLAKSATYATITKPDFLDSGKTKLATTDPTTDKIMTFRLLPGSTAGTYLLETTNNTAANGQLVIVNNENQLKIADNGTEQTITINDNNTATIGNTQRYICANFQGAGRFAYYKSSSNQTTARLYKKGGSGVVVEKIKDPVIEGPADGFKGEQQVTITCATEGAEIYYTLDGTTEPDANATKYDAPISISNTTTVKAIAIKDEEKSNVIGKTFTAYVPAAPTFAGEQSFVESTTVTISAEEGATVYYTYEAEGEPANEYTGPLTLTETTTIRAIAVVGSLKSAENTYTVTKVAPTAPEAPVFEGKDKFTDSTTVTITAAEGAAIYYNLNSAEDPTTASTAYNAETGIELTETTTIKAIAVKYDLSSPVATYTVTKVDPSEVKDYTLVTSTDELNENDSYIIACNTKNMAMKTAVNGTKGIYDTTVVFSEDKNTLTPNDETLIFKLVKGTTGYYFETTNYGTTPQRLAINVTKSSNNISLNANGTENKVEITTSADANISYSGTKTRYVRYNAKMSPAEFRAYESGQTPVQIYRKASGPVVETVAKPEIAGEEEFKGEQTITISCATEGATIYYNLNSEEDPTAESTAYTEEGIKINATTTVKAIAVKEGMTDSEVAVRTFTLLSEDQLSKPVIEGPAERFYGDATVTITWDDPENTMVYYTLDGTIPTEENHLEYDSAEGITISETTTVTAVVTDLEKFSEPETATFTSGNVKSIRDLYTNGEKDQTYMFYGDLTAVYQYSANAGNYLFVKDAEGLGLQFYNSKNAGAFPAEYLPGQKLTNVKFTYTDYKNNPQCTPDMSTFPTEGLATEAQVIEPVIAASMDEACDAMNYNRFMMVKDVTMEQEGNNFFIYEGEKKMQIFNRFGLDAPVANEGSTYAIAGFPILFTSTNEIYYTDIIEFKADGSIEIEKLADIPETLEMLLKLDKDLATPMLVRGHAVVEHRQGNEMWLQDEEEGYTGTAVQLNLPDEIVNNPDNYKYNRNHVMWNYTIHYVDDKDGFYTMNFVAHNTSEHLEDLGDERIPATQEMWDEAYLKANYGKAVALKATMLFGDGTVTVYTTDETYDFAGHNHFLTDNTPSSTLRNDGGTWNWNIGNSWPENGDLREGTVAGIIVPEKVGETTKPAMYVMAMTDGTITGVDSIVNDFGEGVSVEGGNINAPEGSRIFTIGGAQVSGNALPAGIYIVAVPDGKAVKVVVK